MPKPTREQRQRHDPFSDFEVEEREQPASVAPPVSPTQELPEIIAVPIDTGEKNYLNWIKSATLVTE